MKHLSQWNKSFIIYVIFNIRHIHLLVIYSQKHPKCLILQDFQILEGYGALLQLMRKMLVMKSRVFFCCVFFLFFCFVFFKINFKSTYVDSWMIYVQQIRKQNILLNKCVCKTFSIFFQHIVKWLSNWYVYIIYEYICICNIFYQQEHQNLHKDASKKWKARKRIV